MTSKTSHAYNDFFACHVDGTKGSALYIKMLSVTCYVTMASNMGNGCKVWQATIGVHTEYISQQM